jgi:hypothetical protein
MSPGRLLWHALHFTVAARLPPILFEDRDLAKVPRLFARQPQRFTGEFDLQVVAAQQVGAD